MCVSQRLDAPGNDVGRDVKHAADFRMVEPLAIDEEKRKALLSRKAREEARRRRIAVSADQLDKTCLVDTPRPHKRLFVIVKLGEPLLINLGEGPRVECSPSLIAMLLGEHVVKRAAKKRGRLDTLADKEVGEAL